MDTKKTLLATLAGGATDFILGFLLYVPVFGSFFQAEAAKTSASGVERDPMLFLGIALSSLVTGFLFTYIFSRWAGISTFMGGMKAGALLYSLIALSQYLLMYSTSNTLTLNAAILNVVLAAILGGVMGGVIGVVLGSGKK